MMQPKRMSFSSAICGNLPTASIAHRSSQKCHSSFKPNQISVSFPEAQKRKNHGPLVIRTVRNKLKADIRNDDNGSSEPAVAIPERPLAKTQKLEKRTTEEDIRDAERNVLLENALLNCTKEDLECREGEIAAASAKQKQMEEDLKQANTDLGFGVTEEDIQDAERNVLLENALLDRTKEDLECREGEIAEEDLKQANTDLGFGETEEDILQANTDLGFGETEEDIRDAERNVLLENALLNRMKEDLECREREIAAASAKQKQMEEDLKQANADLAFRSIEIVDLRLLVEEYDKMIASSQSALALKEDEMNKLRDELTKKNEEAALMSSELSSKEQLLNETDELVKNQEEKIQQLQIEVAEKEHDLSKSLQLRKAEEERLKIAEASLEKQTLEWLSAREELMQLAYQVTKQLNDVKGASEDFERVRSLLAEVRSELVSTRESLSSSRRKIDDQSLQFEKQLSELGKEKVMLISLRESLKQAHEEVEIEKSNLRAARAKCNELESHFTVEKGLMASLQEELRKERSLVEQQSQEIILLQKEFQQKQLEYSDVQNLLQVKKSELLEASLQIERMKSEQASLQLLLQEKDFDLLNAKKELADASRDISEIQRLLNRQEEQLIQATAGLEKEEYVSETPDEVDDLKLKFSDVTSSVQRIALLTDNLVSSTKDNESGVLLLLNEEELMFDGVEEECVLLQEGIDNQTMEELAVEKEVQRNSFRLEAECAISVLRRLTEMINQLAVMGESSSMSLDESSGMSLVRMKFLEEIEKEVSELCALSEQLVKQAGITSIEVQH